MKPVPRPPVVCEVPRPRPVLAPNGEPVVVPVPLPKPVDVVEPKVEPVPKPLNAGVALKKK